MMSEEAEKTKTTNCLASAWEYVKFHPTVTDSSDAEKVRAFDFRNTLLMPCFNERYNHCFMATVRLLFSVITFMVILVSAGTYEINTREWGLNPNDGDRVTWFLRFSNIVSLITLAYFVLGVILGAYPPAETQYHKSTKVYALQILWIISFPLSILALVECAVNVFPKSTINRVEEAEVIMVTIMTSIDFILGTQYTEFRWIIYPAAVLSCYLLILMLLAVKDIVVYPALSFTKGAEDLWSVVSVYLILIAIQVGTVVLSKLRYMRRDRFAQNTHGAYRILTSQVV